jgi:hypothetical protein
VTDCSGTAGETHVAAGSDRCRRTDTVYVANDAAAGQNFASHMMEGIPIGSSWLESVYYANDGNHPTVADTGANSNDSWSRQGVKLNNLLSEKVPRDGAIGYVCWTNWN